MINLLKKIALVLALFASGFGIADAKTMFNVSTNTYGSDTNTDIVITYPNGTNAGSSVNIPGFGSFNNGYSVSGGSALATYIQSIYGATNMDFATYGASILIVGNGEIPSGASCYDLNNFKNKLVFFSNQLNKKKFFGSTCASQLTLTNTVLQPTQVFLIAEQNSDGSNLQIDGNGNTIVFDMSSANSYRYNYIFDGLFMNNFSQVKLTDNASNANITGSFGIYNGDYHLVNKGFVRTNTNANMRKIDVYYSIVNIVPMNVTADRYVSGGASSNLVVNINGTNGSLEYSYSKVVNSMLLNNNNAQTGKDLVIDGATLDNSIIKQYNGNMGVITNTGTQLHIKNSTLTKSYVYNNERLYLANNNIGSSAIFNNGTIGVSKGGTQNYTATLNSYCWNVYFSTLHVNGNGVCIVNFDIAPAANNNLVKSAIYNNTDISVLINQQGITAVESYVFNNGGTLSSLAYLSNNLKTKFTTPDSAGTNFYFDDTKYFYSYIASTAPTSLLVSYPYCGATDSTKGVVNNCSITTLSLKTTGKTL